MRPSLMRSGMASVAVKPLQVHRARASSDPHYLVAFKGEAWLRRGNAQRPRGGSVPISEKTARPYLWKAVREQLPEAMGWGHYRQASGTDARISEPWQTSSLLPGGPPQRVQPTTVGPLAIVEDWTFRHNLNIVSTPEELLRSNSEPLDMEYWRSFRAVEQRIYQVPGEKGQPVEGWTDEGTFSPAWVRLEVYLADVGPTVVFGADPVGQTDALQADLDGDTLWSAFVRLNLDDHQSVAAFFERFGAPPSLWGPVWSEGDRWIDPRSLREIQGVFRSAAAEQRVPSLNTRNAIAFCPIWAGPLDETQPVFGYVVADGEGRGVAIQAGLWQQAALSLAQALDAGRVGYCAAPGPFSNAPCGRAFEEQRAGRRLYCSDACRSRVSSRLFYRPRKS